MGKEELDNFRSSGHFCQIYVANSFCVSRTIAIGLTYILHAHERAVRSSLAVETSVCLCKPYCRKQVERELWLNTWLTRVYRVAYK
jgi:hypothetical protein